MATFGTAEITINNGQPMPGMLNVEYQIIDVTSANATKPAMSWTLIDDQGHFHAYDDKGELPTLATRSRHVECDLSHDDDDLYLGDDCEGYDVVEYFCAICDQEIQPERVPDTGQKSIPGRMMWSVRIQPQEEIKGKVTVRVMTGDKTLFGVAYARTLGMEHDAFGLHINTQLDGAGPLGERRG